MYYTVLRIWANKSKFFNIFYSNALNFCEALFQVRSGAVDFGGALGGGVEDGDAAGDGVHEDAGEAGKPDGLECAEDGREVELAAAGHLQ